MKSFYSIIFILSLFYTSLNAELPFIKKRVLYINSYHSGYFWSDGIKNAIKSRLLKSDIPIQFKSVEMNTKRNTSESYKLKIAQKLKVLIKEFNPDIVITSDDNAAKYVIVPYFYNSTIPFVFCGINGSAKKYGFPSKNITGILEIQLIPKIIEILDKYSKGKRVGYLKTDRLSSRIEANFFEKQLETKIEKRFILSLDEWKENFLKMQKSVDILLLGNLSSLDNWKDREKEIVEFVRANTKIPTASWDSVMSNKALFTYATIPEEQGRLAANMAIDILKGKDILTIPIEKNKEANIYLNTTLSKKLGIRFPLDLVQNSIIVE